MNSLNQIELQNIRHLCGKITNFCDKIEYYKTLTTDQNLITLYDQIYTENKNLKQNLSNLI